MKGANLISARKLKSFATAIEALSLITGEPDFPLRAVKILEGFFGSEIIAYNDFSPNGRDVHVFSNVDFDPGEKLKPIFLALLPEHPLGHCVLKDHYLAGLRITDAMPASKYLKTAIYNEFYKKIDGDFQMAVVFPGQDGHTIGYAFNQKLRDFSDEELLFLQWFFPHLYGAHKLHHARRMVDSACETMGAVLSEKRLGAVGFNRDRRVYFVNAEAEIAMQSFLGCRPHVGAQLPGPLLDCIRQLEGCDSTDGVPAPRQMILQSETDGSRAILRLWIDPADCCHYLILEPEHRLPRPDELKALGFTLRQQEIAGWIFQGKTNWEIATILGISIRTVEKHVEHIFSRMGVASRSGLQPHVLDLLAHKRPDFGK